jgi:hypothetical protein
MSDVRSPMTMGPTREGGTVVPGSTVRVQDTDGEHEHTVVGRVTVGAPAGMRLRRITVGHGCARAQASDEVVVHTCTGVHLLTVVAVATEAVRPRGGALAHAREEGEARCHRRHAHTVTLLQEVEYDLSGSPTTVRTPTLPTFIPPGRST